MENQKNELTMEQLQQVSGSGGFCFSSSCASGFHE